MEVLRHFDVPSTQGSSIKKAVEDNCLVERELDGLP